MYVSIYSIIIYDNQVKLIGTVKLYTKATKIDFENKHKLMLI